MLIVCLNSMDLRVDDELRVFKNMSGKFKGKQFRKLCQTWWWSKQSNKKLLTESKVCLHMFDRVDSFYHRQCNHLGIVHISFHSMYHDMSHLIF